MPKKRKTRKEKMLLDQKRQTTHGSASPIASLPTPHAQPPQHESTTGGIVFSIPEVQDKTVKSPQKAKELAETITVSTNEYSYLSNDLMRTALLTGAIVFAELFIKLFIVH